MADRSGGAGCHRARRHPVERLLRRRDHAETLVAALADVAEENARLYAEQRTVAQRLQHSLLPETFPRSPGSSWRRATSPASKASTSAATGTTSCSWTGDGCSFVVGDVSGRGLDAAAMMASLRYATRGLRRGGRRPAAIVTKLGKLIDVARDGHFATMLCGAIDVAPAG